MPQKSAMTFGEITPWTQPSLRKISDNTPPWRDPQCCVAIINRNKNSTFGPQFMPPPDNAIVGFGILESLPEEICPYGFSSSNDFARGIIKLGRSIKKKLTLQFKADKKAAGYKIAGFQFQAKTKVDLANNSFEPQILICARLIAKRK